LRVAIFAIDNEMHFVICVSDEHETTRQYLQKLRKEFQSGTGMAAVLLRFVPLTDMEKATAGKDKAMTQLEDWKRCKELHDGRMYHEAAESGYDSKAAWAAKEPYLKAIVEYEEKYGEMFNPEREPETSIMEDFDELGLRIEYNAFLCTPGSPLWDFETWCANREAA
jgi:hypothetical protein